MNIVCSTDEAFVQHCGTMLCSLLENNRDATCRIFVIANGTSEASRQRLTHLVETYGQKVEWRTVDVQVLQGARVQGHVSLASYFRVLIPRILPDEVDKALYLDGDIIVRGHVAEFYNQSVGNFTHAAVDNEFQSEWWANGATHAERLGIPVPLTYFNAGVLLLNVRAWREENLTGKVLDYMSANTKKLLFFDQDALNATLHGRWLRSDLKWNAQPLFFSNYSPLQLGVSEEGFHEARANPQIVHFSALPKPWSYYSRHPFKGEYYKYLSRTPWRAYRPEDTPTFAESVVRRSSQVTPELVKRGIRRLVEVMR